MHLKLRRTLMAGSVSGILLLLTACASNSGSNQAPSSLTVSVTGAATVALGSTAQYAASVTGSSNQAVTWNVNQAAGGNAQVGTISPAGLYSAPTAMPSSGTVVIAAVSAADSSISGIISVTLQAPGNTGTATSVTVTGPSTISIGTPAQYSAAVAGTQNQSVTWAINGVAGGNATFGMIASSGLYTPPATVPTANAIVITATSAATPSVSGNLNATILGQLPVITNAVGSTADSGLHFLVDIQGTGFLNGATILIGGQAVTTDAVAQNDLQTTVSDPSAQPMQISVVVQNPNPGGAQSTPVNVSLTLPVVSATAAARFLDQTSFGPTADSIAHVQQIGLQAALTEQFNQPATMYVQPPATVTECASSSNYSCTQSDFVKVSAWGNDQLRQRVAMALSEIWVAPIRESNAMPFYLNTLATDAFTNYRTVMEDVTLSPQMGQYLNMWNSGAPAKGQIANENFGREMMQLFTMGLNLLNADGTPQTDGSGNAIPAYTELQVEAFARAYTGWTYANADGSSPADFNWSTANWNHAMVPVEKRHDTTQKILLNGTTLPAGQTAEDDLKGALDNIFAHPNVGPFVCRQLIQHLVTGNPSSGYVQRVSEVFANNGSGVRGDMKAVLTAIFMDQEARAGDAQTGDQAESNPAVDGGHLREPLLWTMNLVRGLAATQTNPGDAYPFVSFMSSLNPLGEVPFNQSSVFNYFPPDYFIPQTDVNSPEFGLENTGTIVPRLTLANNIIHSKVPGLTVDLSATSAIGQKASDPAQLADYLGMLFMHSQMPTDMRRDLITAISAIPVTDLQSRAQIAVYLVVTSSQYKVIH